MNDKHFPVAEFQEALLSVDRVTAKGIIQEYFNGNNAFELIKEIISPALERIGDMWTNGEIALSQEYMAGKISEDIVENILPESDVKRMKVPVIGITTLGDEHMLGKRIVHSFLRSCGFLVHDYTDKNAHEVSKCIKEDGVEVLMVSTLMLNLAYEVRKLRTIMDTEGINTKIIVGGAPFLFDKGLWKEVGADAMAVDAMESFKIIYALIGEQQ